MLHGKDSFLECFCPEVMLWLWSLTPIKYIHLRVRWTNVFTCTSVVTKVNLRQLEDKHLL